MLTIQLSEVEDLRKNLLPLYQISKNADFRCSGSSVSFTVASYHCNSGLYVQLQILEPFFTVLSFNPPAYPDFQSSVQIDDFFVATFVTGTDDRTLTFLMPDDYTVTNLIFTSSVGHLQYFFEMDMGPPLNFEVSHSGGGAFVSIDAERFRDIARKLCAFDTRIWVTATATEVRFSARVMEIVLPKESGLCTFGGFLEDGEEARFSVTLIPLHFYIQASLLDKMVYFYRSVDGYTLVTFETGNWTTIVAHNPQDRWEILYK